MNNKTDTKIIERNDITYYINEKKRTVVCKRTDCYGDVVSLLHKLIGGISIPSDVSVDKTLFLKNEYTGTAKCNPEDKWDEETGMTLARNRMLCKYYTDKIDRLNRCEDLINNQLNLISVYTNRYVEKAKNLSVDI